MAPGLGFVLLIIAINEGFCKVPFEQPEFTEPIKNHTVDIGKNITFSCHVKNLQSFKVAWVKVDTKAIQSIGMSVITHNPRIRVNHEHNSKWNLHIIDAQLEDGGLYMCQLNTEPMTHQMGSLEVFSRTDIVEVSTGDSVFEGGTAKLTCRAEGHPKPSVYWKREDKGLTIIQWNTVTGKREEVEKVYGEVLTLHKVRRSQMGTYLCIASNGHPPTISQRVRLAINFRPVIKVPQSEISFFRGEDATIECIVEAYPKGVYYWEADTGLTSGEIQSSSGKYRKKEYDIEEYMVRSRLTILNFGPEDVGTYKCVCKNDMNLLGDKVQAKISVGLATTSTTLYDTDSNQKPIRSGQTTDYGTTYFDTDKSGTTVTKTSLGQKIMSYDFFAQGQTIDNSNRYYPDLQVTPETVSKDRYSTSSGLEEMPKDSNKKQRNSRKNTFMKTESRATSFMISSNYIRLLTVMLILVSF